MDEETIVREESGQKSFLLPASLVDESGGAGDESRVQCPRARLRPLKNRQDRLRLRRIQRPDLKYLSGRIYTAALLT